MNALIVRSDEIIGGLIKIPKIRVAQGMGFELPVSVLGGERFWGKIENEQQGFVTIRLLRKLLPLARLDVTLMVGLCRPQTVKKVLAVAVQTGVRTLCFVKTERGEKSYLSANILKNLEAEVIKSLEQTGDSRGPEIKIYKTLAEFLVEKRSSDGVLFALDGDPVESIKTPTLLCLGPEAGFSDREEAMMKEFKKIKLSDRILRVEIAVAMAIGKVC